jgi:hypothetical protein
MLLFLLTFSTKGLSGASLSKSKDEESLTAAPLIQPYEWLKN